MKPADLHNAAARCALSVALTLATPFPLFAQSLPTPSSQLELHTSDAGASLAGAMSRLATDPRDLNALITAGEAALQLEDPRSAMGFFGRADDVSPNNGRVKAGLGRAMLELDQVGDGLRLMEQAGNLGYSDFGLLADRGLARDLTGNQRGAQQDYLAALQLDRNNATVIRRRAVSLGISGQLDMAEAALQPLLYKSDRGAWRDRAFILAMNGKTVEAMDIAGRVMPKPLADAIKPYLERMSMLTPGQRAAAVHMGRFPPGLVSMRVASTAMPVKPVEMAAAPIEKRGKQRSKDAGRKQIAAAEPVFRPAAASQPQPQPQIPLQTRSAQPPAPKPEPEIRPAAAAPLQTRPAPAQSPPRQVASVASPRPDVSPATRSPSAARPVQGPADPAASPAATPQHAAATQQAPTPVSTPVAPPAVVPVPAASMPGESDRTLADIMAEIEIPEAERRANTAAVNLSEIAAMQAEQRKTREAQEAKAKAAADAKEVARLKAETAAKAKAEAAAKAEKKRLADNPARYWLQIGVGRDKGALGFTLRGMKKEHAALTKYDGWSASWGRTNRLVVGPFSNLAKAKAAEAELKKAGSDAFVWRSDAGEELEKVGG